MADPPAGFSAPEYVRNLLGRILEESRKVLAEGETGDRRGQPPPSFTAPPSDVGAELERLQHEACELAIGNPEALTALIEGAQAGTENESCRLALTLLGRLPDPRAVEYLVSVIRTDPDSERRLLAAQSLGQDQGWNVRGVRLREPPPSPSSGPVTDPFVLDELIRLLREDADARVRRGVTNVLTYVQGTQSHPPEDTNAFRVDWIPAFSRVSEALRAAAEKDPDPVVRRQTLCILANATDPVTLDFLKDRALSATAPLDRSTATMTYLLREKNLPEKIAFAGEVMSREPEGSVRANTLDFIRYVPDDPKANEILMTAMRGDPSHVVRFKAFTVALEQDKQSAGRAVALLESLLRDGHPEERSTYETYLWWEEFWTRRLKRAADSSAAQQRLERLRALHPRSTPR